MSDKDKIMFPVLEAMNICHDEGLLDAVISAVSTLTELDDEEKQQLHDVLAVSRARLHEQSEGIYWGIDWMLKEEPTVSKMEQVALKPCPFCAYPVKLETIRHRVGYYYEIQCTNAMCGTSMWDEEKEDLITKWNRRVEE